MNNTTKKIFLWGGLTLGLVLLVWLLAVLGTPKTSDGLLSESIHESDNVKGSRDAQVVLVEYSDLECPFCAQINPVVKQVSERFSEDELAIVYRHFPLTQIHKNAELAARSAESAGKQGKFWDMHDVIFNTQSTWSAQGDAREYFVSLANSIGLDTAQFERDLDSTEVKEKVRRDLASGNKSGVQGTPSFFLNGVAIPTPQTVPEFEALIQAELSRVSQS
jgi:protein-disulfide isomerase